jgi:DNA replication protein DnaC
MPLLSETRRGGIKIITGPHITDALVATLAKHYPDLRSTIEERGRAVLDMSGLDDIQADRISLDLQFYELNPTLPLENLCSHLGNYAPQNSSQEEMLEYAQKLVALDEPGIGAGLFMYGEAGIGKSHLAIGISKEFMRRGLSPNFQIADRYTFGMKIPLDPGQVWVIDDLNSGYHISKNLFKEVVLNAHSRGGRVFVTSNKSYDELMTELFVGDNQANRMRYEDRTRGMFKILKVNGESYRQANAWYR